MAFFLFTRESNFTSHCVLNKIAPLKSFEKLISHSMFYIHTKVFYFFIYINIICLEFIDIIFYYSIAKGMICANYDGLDFRANTYVNILLHYYLSGTSRRLRYSISPSGKRKYVTSEICRRLLVQTVRINYVCDNNIIFLL